MNFAVSDYETWFVKENGSLWKVGDGDYSNISAPNSNLLPQMVLSSGVVQVELINSPSIGGQTEAFVLDSNGTVTPINLYPTPINSVLLSMTVLNLSPLEMNMY